MPAGEADIMPLNPNTTTQISQSERERQLLRLAKTKLPQNTRYIPHQGKYGFLFEITNAVGVSGLFLISDHAGQLVAQLVSPTRDEFKANFQHLPWHDPHETHLHTDGRICLEPGAVVALDRAFSRTVLWWNGLAVFLATGTFPFNAPKPKSSSGSRSIQDPRAIPAFRAPRRG